MSIVIVAHERKSTSSSRRFRGASILQTILSSPRTFSRGAKTSVSSAVYTSHSPRSILGSLGRRRIVGGFPVGNNIDNAARYPREIRTAVRRGMFRISRGTIGTSCTRKVGREQHTRRSTASGYPSRSVSAIEKRVWTQLIAFPFQARRFFLEFPK